MVEREELVGRIVPIDRLVGNITSRRDLQASIISRGNLVATVLTRDIMIATISTKGLLEAAITARGCLVGEISGVASGEPTYNTFMLVYEDGTEVPAVFVEDKVVFTATAKDIRKGKIAATAEGVTEGTLDV